MLLTGWGMHLLAFIHFELLGVSMFASFRSWSHEFDVTSRHPIPRPLELGC